jgi:hypothetical protein
MIHIGKLTIKKKILLISIIFLSLIALICISYASITGHMNVSGVSVNRKSNWKISINNLQEVELNGTAQEVSAPAIKNSVELSDYLVTLTNPSDSVTYTFDVVNDGDYDAVVSEINIPTPECRGAGEEALSDASKVCNHLTYTLTDTAGNEIDTTYTLPSKATQTLKLKLTYNSDTPVSDYPKDDVAISNLGISILYVQANNAKTNPDGSTPYEKQYTIGEELTVKNEKYNVIGIGSDYVTLLKQEPLTVEEVNLYGGVGTENNHVNKNAVRSQGTAYDRNKQGYGTMAYYSSETCGYPYVDGVRQSYVSSGCKSEGATNYANSDIKYVVDAWAADKFTSTDLKEVDGYKARLVQKEELRSQFYPSCSESAYPCYSESTTPSWVYNENYYYWTMTQQNNSSSLVWRVGDEGNLYNYFDVVNSYGAVRPVINVLKQYVERVN